MSDRREEQQLSTGRRREDRRVRHGERHVIEKFKQFCDETNGPTRLAADFIEWYRKRRLS